MLELVQGGTCERPLSVLPVDLGFAFALQAHLPAWKATWFRHGLKFEFVAVGAADAQHDKGIQRGGDSN